MLFSLLVIVYLLSKRQTVQQSIISKVGDRAIGLFFIHMIVKKVIVKTYSFLNIENILFNDLINILMFPILIYFIGFLGLELFSKITKGQLDLTLGFK